ncbi:high-potential iron-sulfur protein [soil metagenome]
MSNFDSNNSRREFLKISGLGLIGAAALGTLTLGSTPAKAEGAKLPMVAETEPMAKSLGYHADATKVDTKKWPKRAQPDGKAQFCHTCILFNGAKPTTDKEGACSLFAGKHVAAGGWCNSWAKNPAAKV